MLDLLVGRGLSGVATQKPEPDLIQTSYLEQLRANKLSDDLDQTSAKARMAWGSAENNCGVSGSA